jgi:amino acid transporter
MLPPDDTPAPADGAADGGAADTSAGASEDVTAETAGAGDTEDRRVLFGTFTGVFTPTLLTIFGVIMYVRIGWSVGNAGIMGTWLVMALAIAITTATGLSLSSIATNTKVGPGGPYAIMSRSLGFDVGGAIGVPLFLTRPLGVAMYIIGFREGWQWVFPHHDPILVDAAVFVVLAAISFISANLAFRVQFLIMAIIAGSLVSIFASPVTLNVPAEIPWWGDYAGFPESGFVGTDFWGVFAVFFPATTGILAGANMSGDLRDPRKAIPYGTLWAIVVSSVFYFAIAFWVAGAGDKEELLNNYTIVIDKSLWPPIVLAGLLGATASSALAGLVGGPRILQAMGENRIIPFSDAMSKTGPDGNPRAAVLVTAVLTAACVAVRDLNTIAPLVTMFFLITYAMLNVVVLVEGRLGLVSFRPTLRIPLSVPLFGLAGCIFSMFIVNPTFGLVSIGLVFGCFLWIRATARPVDEAEDVRSSVFVSVAQWAASRVTESDQLNKRAWKPNLLVPVRDAERIRGEFELLLDFTRPDGSVTLLGLGSPSTQKELRNRLVPLSEAFRKNRVQSSTAVVTRGSRRVAIETALETLQAAFFRPNVLVLNMPEEDADDAVEVLSLLDHAKKIKVGMILVGLHALAGLGRRKKINLWIRPAPGSWDAVEAFSSGNLNLNLLTGYRLMRRWNADLTINTVITDEEERAAAEKFHEEIVDLARYPSSVKCQIISGEPFLDAISKPEREADVNIVGWPENHDVVALWRVVNSSRSTCLFVRDSGRESALV